METSSRVAGSVYFDADCPFCVASVRRFERLLSRHHFELVPLQAPGARQRLGVAPDHLLDELRLRTADGAVYGGAAAILEVARRISWTWPLWAFSRLPGVMPLLSAGYRWYARRRNCAQGFCRRDAI